MGGFTVPVSDAVAPQGNSVPGVNNTTNPGFVMPTSDADTLAGDVLLENLKSGAGYDSTVTRVGPTQRGVVGGTDTGQQTPTTPTQPVTQQVQVPITPTPDQQAGQALFPNLESNNPTPWGGVKDIGSLPLRIVAGTGLATGEAINQAVSPGPMNTEKILQTYLSGLANPVAEVQNNNNNNNNNNTQPNLSVPVLGDYIPPAAYKAASTAAAGMAANPLTLPTFATPSGALGALGVGLKLGAANYLSNVEDRLDQGQTTGAALTNEDKRQLISDLAPIVVGGVTSLGGKVVKGVGGLLGEAGIQKARDLLYKIIGPGPRVNGGQEARGLAEGLQGTVNGKRMVPSIVKGNTWTPVDVAENYRAVKAPVDASFEPTFERMDKAGVVASQKDAMDEATSSLDKERESGHIPVTDAEANRAIDWANQITGTPEKPGILKLRREVAAGKQPDVTVGYVINKQGRKFVVVRSGESVPEHFYPISKNYKLPDGSWFYGDPNAPSPYMSAKRAHFTKSGMWKEAYEGNPDNITARKEIAHGVGTALREQLTRQIEDIDPKTESDLLQAELAMSKGSIAERNAARAEYAKLMERARPLYQMEDAMERAETTGANKGLLTGKDAMYMLLGKDFHLFNPGTWPAAVLSASGLALQRPQTALMLDKFGEATKGLEDIGNTRVGSGIIKAAGNPMAKQTGKVVGPLGRAAWYGSTKEQGKQSPPLVRTKTVTQHFPKSVTKKKG